MKKIISLALAGAIALSIPASAVDVYKNVDLDATVTLPETVSVDGSQQNVTWEITKFSTATEGIITIPGYVTDNPEVKVDYHISVTENASSNPTLDVKVLFADKKLPQMFREILMEKHLQLYMIKQELLQSLLLKIVRFLHNQ